MKKLLLLLAGAALATIAAAAASGAAPQPSAGPAAANAAASRGLTEVDGIKVGSHTLTERPTGCTVILVDGEGVPGGVAQRGGAPGTSETNLLDPLNLVDQVNAVVLAGGSAFGLDARQGVVRFLEERQRGWRVATGVVPIVPAAILFDLGFGGRPGVRPTEECGYRAAQAATSDAVVEGNVGAGAGATVGKMGGDRPMKGGLGSAAIALPNGLVVGAIVAVNARGDVIDPATSRVVAGVRTEDGRSLADVRQLLRKGAIGGGAPQSRPGENTTIGLVATNARLSKVEVNRMALMADDGLARAINPSHTAGDGDTVFALATGRWNGDANTSLIGALAAEAMAEAIVRAVSKADSAAGVPSARELGTVPERLR